jgi:hypothetical protein
MEGHRITCRTSEMVSWARAVVGHPDPIRAWRPRKPDAGPVLGELAVGQSTLRTLSERSNVNVAGL